MGEKSVTADTVFLFPDLATTHSRTYWILIKLYQERIVMINKFLKNEKGATAVEYGILVTVIAAAAIPAMIAVSGGINEVFYRIIALF